ncbi:MAG: hypothetical protein ACWGON_12225 [Gemmatimonadota bacterium]
MTTSAGNPDGRTAPPAIAVASLYQEYLITRQTGRAVRDGIERLFSDRCGEALAVIDFRDVAVIDFSCADEVVAKLVMSSAEDPDSPDHRFVLVRGVREHHLDPVEGALRRRGLAVAAERETGEPLLLGDVDPDAGAAWQMLCACGRIRSNELALRMGLEPVSCDRLLADLYRRRLVRRCGDEFESLAFTASSASETGAPNEDSRVDRPATPDG